MFYTRLTATWTLVALLGAAPISLVHAQQIHDADAINVFLHDSILHLTSIVTTDYEDPILGTGSASYAAASYTFELMEGYMLFNYYGVPGPILPITWKTYQEGETVYVHTRNDGEESRAEVVAFEVDRLVINWLDEDGPPGIHNLMELSFGTHQTVITRIRPIDEVANQARLAALTGTWRIGFADGAAVPPGKHAAYSFFEDGSFEEVASDGEMRAFFPRASSGYEMYMAESNQEDQRPTHSVSTILEVDVTEFVRQLAAEDRIDDHFQQALTTALRSEPPDLTFGDAFIAYFEEHSAATASPASYFAPNAEEIDTNTPADLVADFIDREVAEFTRQVTSILGVRFSDTGESVMYGTDGHTMTVHMHGLSGSFDMNTLIAQELDLEFRLTPDRREVGEVRDALGAHFDSDSGNPLLDVFDPAPREGPVIGFVTDAKLAELQTLLDHPDVRAVVPAGIDLVVSTTSSVSDADGTPVRELLAVRSGPPVLAEDHISQVKAERDFDGGPIISLVMTPEGSQLWEEFTGAHVSRVVAMIINGEVYSYPRIIDRITGGRTQITGVTRSEAAVVAALFNSSPLPAPVTIRRMVIDSSSGTETGFSDPAVDVDVPRPNNWLMSQQGWVIPWPEGFDEGDGPLSGSLLVLQYENRPTVYLLVTEKSGEAMELHSVYGLWSPDSPERISLRRD